MHISSEGRKLILRANHFCLRAATVRESVGAKFQKSKSRKPKTQLARASVTDKCLT